MKKFRVALVTALVLLVSVLCLVACGGVTGTYKFDSMTTTMGGVTTTVKAGEEYMGTKIEADTITLTLNSDNTCSMKTMESSTEATGTWKEDGDKIIVTVGSEDITFTKDGSSLVMEMSPTEGVTIKTVLKK